MYKLLKKTNSTERMLILFSIFLILIQVWLDLTVPDYMSKITTLLQESGTTTSDIFSPGMIMILFSFLSFAVSMLVGYFAAKIAAGLTFRIRGEVFDRITDYSTSEIQHFSVPSLVTRTTNDLTQIQTLVAMGLQVIIKGPITAVWAITKIANKNWAWTVTTGIAVFILIALLTIIMIFVRPKFTLVQGLTDKINGITRENLTGIRVIRAYNAEHFQEQKFEETNNQLTQTNLFTGRMMAFMNPVMSLISSGLTLAVYWIGAYLIQEATGTEKLTLFSDMVVFTSYAMQVVSGFMMMTIIFFILPRAMVSRNRINEVLDLEPSIKYPNSKNTNVPSEKEQIVFKNVSFSYPEAAEPVLREINFTVSSGDTVAFIGSTGSGKSTLLKLTSRLYDVSSGEILLNGQSVKCYSQNELNNTVGYIPQKAILFSGTIRSNMNLGQSNASPLDDSKIEEALHIAQAKDFVDTLDKKMDAPVSQGGTNFSGGQKQRLAIARAIARQPEILLFDDSFSALDYETDKKLREQLAKKLPKTTKLIVAQRISTIMDADLIIVLNEGTIVGKGTHSTLLKENSVYQEIAYSQLSKEELENE